MFQKMQKLSKLLDNNGFGHLNMKMEQKKLVNYMLKEEKRTSLK